MFPTAEIDVGGVDIPFATRAKWRTDLGIQFPGSMQPVAMIDYGDSRGLETVGRVLLANAALRRNLLWWNSLSVAATESGTANNGALATTRLDALKASIEAAQAAGYLVDVIVSTGGNDFPSGIAPATTLANIKQLHTLLVGWGVRLHWMVGIYPSFLVGSLGGFDLLQSLNAGISDMALTMPQMVPLMPGPAFLDLAASAWLPVGGGTGTVGSTAAGAPTVDGTHDSFFGHLVSAAELEIEAGPFARAFGRLSDSDVISTLSGFTSATQTPQGNMLGAQGRMRALGGTNSSTGGTVTGTPPAGWTLSGALGGLAVTFETAGSPELRAMYNTRADVPVVRMTVSGTPSADVTLNLARSNTPSGGCPAGQYRHELLAFGRAIQGLCGFGLTTNVAQGGNPLFGNVVRLGRIPGGPRSPADALPATTHALGGHHIASQASAAGSITGTVYALFEQGQAVSGSIDLAGACTRRIIPVA
jgi:hypothetical protein